MKGFMSKKYITLICAFFLISWTLIATPPEEVEHSECVHSCITSAMTFEKGCGGDCVWCNDCQGSHIPNIEIKHRLSTFNKIYRIRKSSNDFPLKRRKAIDRLPNELFIGLPGNYFLHRLLAPVCIRS
jgi:hypothetical protein